MFKNFFFTIFLSLVFVSFLEASNEKINQQIYELKTSQDYAQKINDEKITLIMGQIIQKENEIKELENKIDELRKDKNSLENYKNIIDRQDKRIEDIHSNVNFWGVVFTLIGTLTAVIIILYTLKFGAMAVSGAEKEVKDWIDKKADEEFKLLIEQAKEEIYNNADNAINEIKKESTIKVDDFMNELQKNSKGSNKVYKYSALFKLVIQNYQTNNLEKSLDYIEKAIEYSESEKELSEALFTKALLLEKMEQKEESIKVYDELVKKLKDSKDKSILEQVAQALLNKGIVLGEMGKNEEEIYVYDEVVKRFEGSKDKSILKQVVNALLNKIECNLILNKNNTQKDLNLYFELVKDKKSEFIKYKILTLLEKAKDSEIDEEVISWKEEFKDTFIEKWSFQELKDWANSFADEEVKERLLRYIDIFEKHNESVEEKQSNI